METNSKRSEHVNDDSVGESQFTNHHHDTVDCLDQPPSPPPPPPQIPISTVYISSRPAGFAAGDGQLSQKMKQKELRLNLVQAIERHDLPAVHHLVCEGVQLDCTIMFNKTPLTYAIERKFFDIAKTLVRSGADVNAREPIATVQQPLHVAVDVGSCEMMDYLLQHGAEVNGGNGCGATPMMLASFSGQLQAVELLHACGADLNARDTVGRTALHRAAEGQHSSVMSFLLAKGADINVVDEFGWTALYHSIVFQNIDTMKLLLDRGISVNGFDVYCQSPVLVACHRLSVRSIRVILSTSLDYHKRQRRIPTTELHVLLTNGDSDANILIDFEILQLLVNAGAELDLTNLGDYLQYLPEETFFSESKQALWYYLIFCNSTKGHLNLNMIELGRYLPKLEDWLAEKKSLQQLCRIAVRSHLVRMQCRDINDSLRRMPIPNALKNFLNLYDFFEKYPQFLPCSLLHVDLMKSV